MTTQIDSPMHSEYTTPLAKGAPPTIEIRPAMARLATATCAVRTSRRGAVGRRGGGTVAVGVEDGSETDCQAASRPVTLPRVDQILRERAASRPAVKP